MTTEGADDTTTEELRGPSSGFLAMSAGNSPLAIIPNRLGDVVELATAIHASGLAPQSLNTPDKVTVAILKGLELGLPPMQALESIAVINGRAALWGDVGLALILRSGLLEEFDEGWRQSDPDDIDTREAWIKMKRKGLPPMTKTFSVKEAKVAMLWEAMGLTADKRAKAIWVLHPDTMLLWRARWRLWRAIFTDVLKNMPGAEEMQGETIDVTPNPPPVKATVDVAEKLTNGRPMQATYAVRPEKSPQKPQDGRSGFSGTTTPPASETAAEATTAEGGDGDTGDGTLFDPPKTVAETAIRVAHAAMKPAIEGTARRQPAIDVDFALIAEIEEELGKARTPADVLVLSDEYAGALMAAKPDTKAKAELLMSVRSEALSHKPT